MGQTAYAGQERRAECVQGARLAEKVNSLEKYQGIQNGHIKTIRGQLWALVLLMLTTAGTAIAALVMMLSQRA